MTFPSKIWDTTERIAKHAETREQLLEKADELWAEFRKSETIEAMGKDRAATAERVMEGLKALLKGGEEAAPFVGERFRRALTEASGEDRSGKKRSGASALRRSGKSSGGGERGWNRQNSKGKE